VVGIKFDNFNHINIALKHKNYGFETMV